MLAISRLKLKLILISFVCLLPLTLLLGALFYKHESDLIKAEQNSTLHSTALSISIELESFLEQSLNEAQLIANHPGILEAIEDRQFERVIANILSSLNTGFASKEIFLLDESFSLAATAAEDKEEVNRIRVALADAQFEQSSDPMPHFTYYKNDVPTVVVMLPVAPDRQRIAWLAFLFDFDAILQEKLVLGANKLGPIPALDYTVSFQFQSKSLNKSPLAASKYEQRVGLDWLDNKFDLLVSTNESAMSDDILPSRFAIYASLILLLVLQVVSLSCAAQSILLRRLSSLRDKALQFSEGNQDARVDVTGNDEVADLGRVFNNMCVEIVTAQNALKDTLALRTRQVQESSGRLEAILRSVGEAIISIDDTGTLISFNLAAEKIFSYSEQEILGKNVSILMPEHQADEHDGHLREALLKSESEVLGARREVQAKRKNGENFPASIHITRGVRDGKVFFIGAIRDLSGERKTEFQLEKQQKLFEIAIQNSSQPFVLVKPDGNFIKVNEALCEWLGYSDEELMSMSVMDAVSDQYKASTKRAIEKLSAGDIKSVAKERRYKKKDGTFVWGLVSAAPIRNEDGDVEMFVTQIIDIDDAKRMAKALKNRNIELEKSNADLDQFAYLASHDLKSPLNAIQKIVTWIEEDAGSSLDEGVLENIALIKSRAARMLQLLNDLLLYSRVGRVDTEVETIKLKELVHTSFDMLDGAERFELFVDDASLVLPKVPFELVVRNLLSNAIKHHDKKFGAIRVSFGLQQQTYIIRFADDGPGIPQSMHERVLEMFQTLKSRDTTEGSGMGLALVRKAVEHYLGSVKIESSGERGTTIVVRWPQNNSIG